MQEEGEEAYEEIIKGKSKLNMDKKKSTLEMLRISDEVYTLLSRMTNLPYVECDPETYDDQIFIFFDEGEAKKAASRLLNEKAPVQAVKVEKRSFLVFYTALYPMGVNCIVVNEGTSERIAVQLEELIQRADPQKLPKGQIWVENPQFHLTAIYFVQKIRKNPGQEMTDELKALYEEMLAHFGRGRYIFAARQDQGILVLKGQDGQAYQPLFTDSQEFQKFNREKKLRAMVVDAGKLVELVPPECSGVVVNPMGVNVQLKLASRN